jgi:hypothetical protein
MSEARSEIWVLGGLDEQAGEPGPQSTFRVLVRGF